ncbi:MAG TPA: pseudouridine synthase [Selenomonas sp.]|nr:rRNA pseudouridine synthase [Selenomonadaceae bacterium]HCB93710.1 pseudouridine synthase [Selenomonas sp.]
MEERLQKIISTAGIASRRAAEKMILEGRVTLDGVVVKELGTKCEASEHTICVDGKRLESVDEKIYLLLNKPRGYLSTAKDDRGRKTVLELMPEISQRVYPVGRLDYQTEGALLITNDGALMHGLLHPAFEVEKTYKAAIWGRLTDMDVNLLRTGIKLEEGMTAPAKVEVLSQNGMEAKLEITIHEGRNRQVRRMLAAVECDVKSLERIRFAGLSLKGLARGKYRRLTEEEIAHLYRLAGKRK